MRVAQRLSEKWSLILVLLLVAVLASTAAWAAPSRDREAALLNDGAAVAPVIPYQGRLLNPSNGEPKDDGDYTMSFRIYDAASGGNELWHETKDVAVSQGLFFTYLGDVNSLDQAIFAGAERWLGVKVGADAEATPRMRLGFAPYAVWAINADTVDGQDASAFAASDHGHAAFANIDHDHDSRYVNTSGPESITGDSSQPILSVQQSGSGPAVGASGEVKANRFTYNSARTHYLAIPGEAFQPGRNVDYVNTYGMGGAYVSASGFHAMVAPVYLPDGARVTKLTGYFADGSTSDLTARLNRLYLESGGYNILASVTSNGSSGYQSVSDTSISNAVIDNTTGGYGIYAFSSAWDSGNLRLMGVVITYTIDEAP